MRMFTVFVAAALSMSGAASPAVAQSIELGLTGGYNRTDWTVEPAAEAAVGTGLEARNTFSLGALAGMAVTSALELQTEVLYTRRGTAFQGQGVLDGEAVTFDAAYETSYVQLPLLVRLSLPGEPRIDPMLLAGPMVAFEWGSRVKGTVASGGVAQPFEAEADGLFKGTDLGVVLGAGIGTARGEGMVYLNVRYEIGFSPILEPIDGEDPGAVKNRAFGILLGVSTPVEI